MTTADIVTSVAELQRRADATRRAGGVVGFFGTSGNLHEGHLSIIRRMSGECDISVMPQFLDAIPGLLDRGPNDGYERDFEHDLKLAELEGLDIVFRPTVEDMFPRLPVQTYVVPDVELALPWRNAENPAFMRQVATKLLKYWNLVAPCRVYVGEKDLIPLAVLRRMIEDLSPRVELVPCAIVRLEDGLCASSRNSKLSPQDRSLAPVLYRTMQSAAAQIRAGERSASAIRALLRGRIGEVAKVDYAEIVDSATLQRVDPLAGEMHIAVSANFSGTHLFDNLGISLDP